MENLQEGNNNSNVQVSIDGNYNTTHVKLNQNKSPEVIRTSQRPILIFGEQAKSKWLLTFNIISAVAGLTTIIKNITPLYNQTINLNESHKVSQVGYYVNDYKTNKTDLYDIVKNESPIICVNSNFRKPPRKLNLLQKTTLYQFLILKINSKLKRNIKKFTYKLLKKKNKSEIPNYTKVDL